MTQRHSTGCAPPQTAECFCCMAMEQIEVKKSNDYSVIRKSFLFDSSLSLKAKAVMAIIMTASDEDMDFSVNGLTRVSSDGRTSVISAMKELYENGYLERKQETDSQGRFVGCDYRVFEEKQHFGTNVYARNPTADNPTAEFQNPTIYNNNNRFLYNKNFSKETIFTLERNKENGTKEKEKSSLLGEIVSYLNERTGKHFRASSELTKRHINARIREGFSLQDFKSVIDAKVSCWGNDEKMREYLRPETLFGTKFESYLNATTNKHTNDLDDIF